MTQEAVEVKEKKENKERTEKKEKKDKEKRKKEKRADKDGVHKSKKERKERVEPNGDAASALLHALAVEKPEPTKEEPNEDVVMRDPQPIGALVPFANPLADEKIQKKVLKSVKKGTYLPISVFVSTNACSELDSGRSYSFHVHIAAKNKSIKRGSKKW